tara:strand:- start:3180 stop:3545 length:366 start_codon:yes stop_codon:yes gene_type:complete
MTSVVWDSKYWDTIRQKALNKRARSKCILLDGISQKPDYENKKSIIVDSNKLKIFSSFNKRLLQNIYSSLKKGKSKTGYIPLICEGNCYFDLKKCGIGFHSDTERTRVICLSICNDNYHMR